MTSPQLIRIATRASELALRQARLVQAALEARGVATSIHTFKTTGDKNLDQPLSAIGGKGLFTQELETALAKRRVDCCVHSLKDLPTAMPDGLSIAAVLKREDPRDVLIVGGFVEANSIAELPRGSRVGTSSLRRRAQLLALRPDLEAVDLRGNVPTRVKKVTEGQVHAAILAAAGLHRLDAAERITAYLDPPDWLPAPGQGAIAVQIRDDDEGTRACVAPLNDAATELAVRAERTFLAALEGGCQVPIGALAVIGGASSRLYGFIANVRGTRVIRANTAFDAADPERAGTALALQLLERGAEEILSELRRLERVVPPQPE